MEFLVDWMNTFGVVTQKLIECTHLEDLSDPVLLAAVFGEM